MKSRTRGRSLQLRLPTQAIPLSETLRMSSFRNSTKGLRRASGVTLLPCNHQVRLREWPCLSLTTFCLRTLHLSTPPLKALRRRRHHHQFRIMPLHVPCRTLVGQSHRLLHQLDPPGLPRTEQHLLVRRYLLSMRRLLQALPRTQIRTRTTQCRTTTILMRTQSHPRQSLHLYYLRTGTTPLANDLDSVGASVWTLTCHGKVKGTRQRFVTTRIRGIRPVLLPEASQCRLYDFQLC